MFTYDIDEVLEVVLQVCPHIESRANWKKYIYLKLEINSHRIENLFFNFICFLTVDFLYIIGQRNNVAMYTPMKNNMIKE